MHNLDRTHLESDFDDETSLETGFDGSENFEGEFLDAEDFEYESSEFDEDGGQDQEFELASELLEIEDDNDMDNFFAEIIMNEEGRRSRRRRRRRRRRRMFRRFAKRLGRGIRKVAKKLLPIAGRVVGTKFGGPAGGALGSKVGSGAGQILGLEIEGLSPEDQDFEVARRIVQMATNVGHVADEIPDGIDDYEAAEIALHKTLEKFAPGFTKNSGRRLPVTSAQRSGRWIRKDGNIILMGV